MFNWKKLSTIALTGVLLFPAFSVSAESGRSCVNPDRFELNRLLTEEALKQNVPPEIVKAIAFEESKGWNQCVNGQPYMSPDGGVGVMQITDHEGAYDYDPERVKYDAAYNIEVGVDILNDKWNMKSIPSLNDRDRDVLENWYFAVMAYNGSVWQNSPLYRANGNRNWGSYQDRVFQKLQDYNPGISLNLALPEVKVQDLNYMEDGNYTLGFHKLHYNLSGEFTKTKHKFKENNLVVTTEEPRLRANPRTGPGTDPKLSKGEVISVQGSFSYDSANANNHFPWYPVQTKDNKTGFVAGSYLTYFGERIYGSNRYATAVEISKAGWEEGMISLMH
ncbi:transglycosylase SLT domain-containing protein [Sutcliffiella cohnii]